MSIVGEMLVQCEGGDPEEKVGVQSEGGREVIPLGFLVYTFISLIFL